MAIPEVAIKHKSYDVKLNVTLQDFKGKINELSALLDQAVKTTSSPVHAGLNLGTGAIQTTSKARAYLSTDQNNIADETTTKVLLDTVTYDLGSSFDVTTNNEFVAPVAGYYFIYGQIHWTAAAAGGYRSYIYIDGAVKARGLIKVTAVSNFFAVPVTDILYVAKDKTVDLRAYHNAGVDTPDIYGAESGTYLTIHLLST